MERKYSLIFFSSEEFQGDPQGLCEVGKVPGGRDSPACLEVRDGADGEVDFIREVPLPHVRRLPGEP